MKQRHTQTTHNRPHAHTKRNDFPVGIRKQIRPPNLRSSIMSVWSFVVVVVVIIIIVVPVAVVVIILVSCGSRSRGRRRCRHRRLCRRCSRCCPGSQPPQTQEASKIFRNKNIHSSLCLSGYLTVSISFGLSVCMTTSPPACTSMQTTMIGCSLRCPCLSVFRCASPQSPFLFPCVSSSVCRYAFLCVCLCLCLYVFLLCCVCGGPGWTDAGRKE